MSLRVAVISLGRTGELYKKVSPTAFLSSPLLSSILNRLSSLLLSLSSFSSHLFHFLFIPFYVFTFTSTSTLPVPYYLPSSPKWISFSPSSAPPCLSQTTTRNTLRVLST
ncbi:hypothetical protein CPB86DRAFT_512053 [Serendipita vermifera]|nr:hypothetical protein CPB86DRAFT_512053 [Serendipita vermifera]